MQKELPEYWLRVAKAIVRMITSTSNQQVKNLPFQLQKSPKPARSRVFLWWKESRCSGKLRRTGS